MGGKRATATSPSKHTPIPNSGRVNLEGGLCYHVSNSGLIQGKNVTTRCTSVMCVESVSRARENSTACLQDVQPDSLGSQ